MADIDTRALDRELKSIDDLGKLAHTAAEDLLELVMRRYERASTMLTSNEVEPTGLGRPAKLPVLPCPQIAGFQLSTEGPSSVQSPDRVARNE